MGGNRWSIAVLALGFLAAVSAPAVAQPVTVPVAVGQKVSITSIDGRTVSGIVSGRSNTSIELPGTSVLLADIERVRLRDSVWDGSGKGATLGLLFGVVAGLGSQMNFDQRGVTDSTPLVVAIVGGVGAGAILGAAIDALKAKTIYERPREAAVSVRPIVWNAGTGLGINVRW